MVYASSIRGTVTNLWVFLSATACLAQMPKPCNPPSQLTFRAVTYDHDYSTVNRYRGSYDAVQQRLAFYEEATTGGLPGKQHYHFIFIYEEGVAYEINLSTKKCVRAPSGRFQGWGIPPNATFEEDHILGGPSDGVEIMEWSDRIPYRKATWFGVYTKKGCYPVNAVIYDPSNLQRAITYNVYDLAEGIDNPDDFIPPSQCSSISDKSRNTTTPLLNQLGAFFVPRY